MVMSLLALKFVFFLNLQMVKRNLKFSQCYDHKMRKRLQETILFLFLNILALVFKYSLCEELQSNNIITKN